MQSSSIASDLTVVRNALWGATIGLPCMAVGLLLTDVSGLWFNSVVVVMFAVITARSVRRIDRIRSRITSDEYGGQFAEPRERYPRR